MFTPTQQISAVYQCGSRRAVRSGILESLSISQWLIITNTPEDRKSRLARGREPGECQKVWGNQAAHASVAGVLPGPRFWGDIVDACELLVDHRVDNPLYDPGRGTRLPQRCRLAVCGSCGHISARIRHCPTLFGTPLLGAQAVSRSRARPKGRTPRLWRTSSLRSTARPPWRRSPAAGRSVRAVSWTA